ncbi:SDR family NAD(P)-dependent oxidoreductase [Caenimonas soli]|jgi:NAD(P)-dependent dehydrogenase (short-subunit alcohol dehydrogenase family)|uniref:SDR family NAD(P)-dependent oxidoreductase n=1 Tax=Caenimonas soli TaxID=2735555 RepID=UPI001557ACA3|nr:SDR family NAD(P)-dependent oxidoreductase [Caenimonas soli]NPC55917.1 SDR family oxidoreductase [Caenimonas soli]
MSARLQDKVTVITGIGSGMGRAAALLFAAEGARVVGCDIDPVACQATLEAIRARGGEAVGLPDCDPCDPGQARRLVEYAVNSFGGVDVVYNNAAVARMAWIEDMTCEMWSTTMRGELDIVFNLVKAAWPHLKQRGGGSIINCGSVSGKMAYEVLPALAHAAGKGGVIAMTRQLAMEGGTHGIRANSISPGLVRTGATAPLIDDANWFAPMKRKLMLNGRVGTPEDVAYCALYLASDESAWVTGADFAIDGGTTAW